MMRKFLMLTTTLIGLSSGAAYADFTSQEIVDMFPGAQKIEIQRGSATTKVEVTINGKKIEVVYDNATNAELSREERDLTGVDTNGDGIVDSYEDSEDDSSDDDNDDDSNDDDGDDDSNDDDGDDDSNDDDGDDDSNDDDKDDDKDDDSKDDDKDDEGDDDN